MATGGYLSYRSTYFPLIILIFSVIDSLFLPREADLRFCEVTEATNRCSSELTDFWFGHRNNLLLELSLGLRIKMVTDYGTKSCNLPINIISICLKIIQTFRPRDFTGCATINRSFDPSICEAAVVIHLIHRSAKQL